MRSMKFKVTKAKRGTEEGYFVQFDSQYWNTLMENKAKAVAVLPEQYVNNPEAVIAVKDPTSIGNGFLVFQEGMLHVYHINRNTFIPKDEWVSVFRKLRNAGTILTNINKEVRQNMAVETKKKWAEGKVATWSV